MIPKLIHFVWLGPAQIPDRFEHNIGLWRALHPAWEVKIWRDEDVGSLGPLIADLPFRMVPNVGTRSDILRIEILLRHGGLYADVDMRPTRPIDTIMVPGIPLQYADERPGKPTNALIAGVRHHPIFTLYLNSVNAAFPWPMSPRIGRLSPYFVTVLDTTGPYEWNRCVHRFLGRRHTHRDAMAGDQRVGVCVNDELVAWSPEIACCRPRRSTAQTVVQHDFSHSWDQNAGAINDDELIYWETIHDQYGLAMIALQPGAVIYDIGAHKGLCALHMRQLFPTASIVAWEPNPDNYWELLTNTAGRNITLHQWAVAAKNRGPFVELRIPPQQAYTGRSTIVANGGTENWRRHQVPTANMVDIMRIENEIDLLKLDCEGAELEIFTDLHHASLLHHIAHIRAETHSAAIRDELAALLELTHTVRVEINPEQRHLAHLFADRRPA